MGGLQQVAECAESVGHTRRRIERRQVDASLYVKAWCRVRWALQPTQLPIRSSTLKETLDVGECRALSRRIGRCAAGIHRGPGKANAEPNSQQAMEGAAMSANRVRCALRSGRLPMTMLASKRL
jgi:hypothetical protein